MPRPSRRAILRSGGALAAAATAGGCLGVLEGGADVGGADPSASGEGLAGVEDGEIVDGHAFAHAHGARLAERTGTLERTVTGVDRETGDAVIHSRATVRVDGPRVHAVAAGRTMYGADVDRLEFYTDAGATIHLRTRSDGEWSRQSYDPDQGAVSKLAFTGTGRLELVEASRAGTATLDGEPLQRFARTERPADDEGVAWVSTGLLVDDGGLVQQFDHSRDDLGEDLRISREWYATALGETTVQPPEWAAEDGG